MTEKTLKALDRRWWELNHELKALLDGTAQASNGDTPARIDAVRAEMESVHLEMIITECYEWAAQDRRARMPWE